MGKRILALLLVLSLGINMTVAYAEGGDAALSAFDDFVISPFVCDAAPTDYVAISTPEDFCNMLNDPDGNYILLADIDLGTWQPSSDQAFSGTLNGNGHTVSYHTDGKVEKSRKLERGLFYALDNAFILNLRVDLVIANPSDDLGRANIAFGGLAAYARGTTLIYNCTVDAQIDLTSVEWDESFSEFNSFEAVKVDSIESKSANTGAGGLIGIAERGSAITMEYCRVNGRIDSTHNVGGFIGLMNGYYCDLIGCENLANLTGISNVGGIIGNAPSASSGYASITCSANRGETTALSNFAGGIVGSSNGGNFYIADCINTGRIVAGVPVGNGYAGGMAGKYSGLLHRCINAGQVIAMNNASMFPGISRVTTDGNSLYCLDNGWNEAEKDNGILMEMDELMTGCTELDGVYVWTAHPEMGIPYPRALLGERFDYFRAAYVQTMKEFCSSGLFKTYIDVSVAGTLGVEYRKAGLNEVNDLWNCVEIINSILGYDIGSLDSLNNYDVLLCDLLLQTTFLQTYESMCVSGGMEVIHELLNTMDTDSKQFDFIISLNDNTPKLLEFSGLSEKIRVLTESTATTSLLRSTYTQLTHCSNPTTTLDHLLKKMTEEMMDNTTAVHFLNKNTSELISSMSKVGNAVQGIAAGYNALTVFLQSMEQEAVEDMAEQIYLDSYDRFGKLLDEIASCPALDPYHSYPEAFDAGTNLGNLKNALNDLRKNAFSREKFGETFQNVLSTAGNFTKAALIPGGVGLEMFLASSIQSASAAAVLSGYGLAKLSFSMGVMFGNSLGLHDVSYYGSMVNSAGYLADRIETLVIGDFEAFQDSGTYEDAIAFRDTFGLYLNLQILACDYALSYSEATGFRTQNDELGDEMLRQRRGELVELLNQLTMLG